MAHANQIDKETFSDSTCIFLLNCQQKNSRFVINGNLLFVFVLHRDASFFGVIGKTLLIMESVDICNVVFCMIHSLQPNIEQVQ